MSEVVDLPLPVLESIFNILIKAEHSYWPCLTQLSQVSRQWADVATWSKLRSALVLDESVILRVKRSHDENDDKIVDFILNSGTLVHLKRLELRHFQRYMNKILGLLDDHITEHVVLRHLKLAQSHGGYLDEKWSQFLTRFCRELTIFEAVHFSPLKQGCIKQVLALPNLAVVRLVNIGPLSGKIDWSIAKNLVELDVADFDAEKYETYYEMSEMEQAMHSAWLPSGRKFVLPKLRTLTLRNVHFVSTQGGFLLDQLDVVTLGPFVFRENENFQTSTHMLSLLLERNLSRVNLVFDERDNWLDIRKFLDSLKSGLCVPLSLMCGSGRMSRENLVFLMLFLASDEILFTSIDLAGLTIVEDGRVLMELDATFERNSPKLDDFLHRLHAL